MDSAPGFDPSPPMGESSHRAIAQPRHEASAPALTVSRPIGLRLSCGLFFDRPAIKADAGLVLAPEIAARLGIVALDAQNL